MNNTRDIAEKFAEAFRGNFEDAKKYLADDYVWWTVGYGDATDTIFKIRAAMDPHVDGKIIVNLIDILVEGDRAAIELESKVMLKNGSKYNNFYHIKLILENGKIKRVTEYFDSAHAQAVWGPVLGAMLN